MDFNKLYRKIAELSEVRSQFGNEESDDELYGDEADFEHDRRKDNARDEERERQSRKNKRSAGVDEAKGERDMDSSEYFRYRDSQDRLHQHRGREHDEFDDNSYSANSYPASDSTRSKDSSSYSKTDKYDTKKILADIKARIDKLSGIKEVRSQFGNEESDDELYGDEADFEHDRRKDNARDEERERQSRKNKRSAGVDEAKDERDMDPIRRATQATSLIKECGDNMMSMPEAAKSVTMNVSMNASTGEGIKELLSVLRDLESSVDKTAPVDMPLVIKPRVGVDYSDSNEQDESFENSPDQDYYELDDLLNSGNDLNKPKQSYKNNPLGGDNKMARDMGETFKQKLQAKFSTLSENAESEPVLDADYSIRTRDDGKFDVICKVKQKNKVRGDTYWKTPKQTPVKTFKTREEAKAHGEQWVAKYKK